MNQNQQRLLAQIAALLREAAHHRCCVDTQLQLQRRCQAMIDVHSGQLEKLRHKVGALLLDLMNSGISHRAYLTIIKHLERTA